MKYITDDNYLRYDNWVFLGKKQIDEEKYTIIILIMKIGILIGLLND